MLTVLICNESVHAIVDRGAARSSSCYAVQFTEAGVTLLMPGRGPDFPDFPDFL